VKWDPWVVVGLLGQSLFFSRFLVQWIASERAGRSVVPTMFWFFSIGGGLVLLTYAISRADPVFILGQSLGLLVYGRNLWMIYRDRGAGSEPSGSGPVGRNQQGRP